MKNILVITGVFPPEPVTSATLNFDLAFALSKDYNVKVLTPRPSRPAGFDFGKSICQEESAFKRIVMDSYVYPASSFYGRMKESTSFGYVTAKYIKDHQSEIDFVYNDGWQLFGLYMVAKTCVKYNIPYIVPIQDIYPESILTKIPNVLGSHWLIKTILGFYDKFYQKHAYKVRTISDSMADYLADTRSIDRSNILTIANWQKDEEFDDYKTTFRKNGKTVFMFVGNNNRQANVELMIRAYHRANLSNAEFRIMGGGNAKEDCQKLVKKLGRTDILFGELPSGMVSATQKEADVMVLALRKGTGSQGVPSKLTAYMFSGKPVIASMEKEADATKMIQEAKAGIVSEAEDIEAFANTFRIMDSINVNKLLEMGNNSRLYAEKKLSRKVNLELLCNCIDEKLR